LSPRDPRFLELTAEEVEAEFWAHHYADNSGKGEEFEDEDFDLAEILNEVNANAGDDDVNTAADDADEWEDVINDRA
jgi:hypothetical protein